MSPDERAASPALIPLDRAPFTFKTLQAVAGTEFVPAGLRNKPDAILACILTGRELGLSPMESLRSIDVIDGKPSPSAELMLRRIFEAGHLVVTVEQNDQTCTVKGMRRENGVVVAEMEFTFNMAMARRAGLASKRNWQNYPEAMLFWRAVAQLARQLFPDVMGALSHLPEELGSEEWEPSGRNELDAEALPGVAGSTDRSDVGGLVGSPVDEGDDVIEVEGVDVESDPADVALHPEHPGHLDEGGAVEEASPGVVGPLPVGVGAVEAGSTPSLLDEGGVAVETVGHDPNNSKVTESNLSDAGHQTPGILGDIEPSGEGDRQALETVQAMIDRGGVEELGMAVDVLLDTSGKWMGGTIPEIESRVRFLCRAMEALRMWEQDSLHQFLRVKGHQHWGDLGTKAKMVTFAMGVVDAARRRVDERKKTVAFTEGED